MSDYRLDEHTVGSADVVGAWLLAVAVVAVLFVLILPFGS